MANRKPWDILGKVDDIAKKSGEGINTGPKKFKKVESKPEPLDEKAYDTRPGAGFKKKKDVNLPINTASQEVKDRMAKLRSLRKH